MSEVLALNPATYTRHAIHQGNRNWAETNCYVDVLIELIHSLGFEPRAALAFTLAIDYEVDQWGFFKFPQADVYRLFGLEIQEFNPWRSLPELIENQLKAGRPVLVEMDSYFLPDTQGMAYKLAHVKSTIAVNKIDRTQQIMGYFHNQGYYELSGQDYRDIFQVDGLVHERMLPTYIEYVKSRHLQPTPSGADLLHASIELLKEHLQLIPARNPFEQFKSAFAEDFLWLQTQDIELFHLYSFSNLRQYGACFELVQTYLTWLQEQGEDGLTEAIEAFERISVNAKTYQFQLARAMARKKTLDTLAIDDMGRDWALGMELLKNRYLPTAG
ncbi:MAG: hypothetical protein RL497_2485 [Pseudomonadota bacterium]